jgi:lantibiotic leader peptide-processing serine protease
MLRSFEIISWGLILFLSFTGCKKEDRFSEDENQALNKSARLSTTTNSKNFIIISKAETVSDQLKSFITSNGGIIQSVIGDLGIILSSSASSEFVGKIKQNVEVYDIIPDYSVNMLRQTLNPQRFKLTNTGITGLTGSNPISDIQWNLKAVNAEAAFARGYKGEGVIVAVLDNGFYLNHPDIAPNVYSSISFVPGEPAQFQNYNLFGHGTHVAGIIAAADNDVGTVGIAPKARLMLIKVLEEGGFGEFGWTIQGIHYAANNGANIINMSFGALLPRNGKFVDNNGTPDPSDDVFYNEAREVQSIIYALNRAVAYARKKGAVTIAPAGNNHFYFTGQGQVSVYPADCPGVISVSAAGPMGWGIDQSTSLYPPAFYTNFGESLIDFSGPGGNLKFPVDETVVTIGGITAAAWVFDLVISDEAVNPVTGAPEYVWIAGTSMASPAVAAVAAIIAGKYPGILPAQLETKLKNSAFDAGGQGFDYYYGHGHVDAGRAAAQ